MWSRASAWWRWRKLAVKWWRIHPPFVFALCEAAFKGRRGNASIEAERAKLEKDLSPLAGMDAGAGSRRKRNAGEATVAQIARTSLKRRRHAATLAAWAEATDAMEILELGTCLGVTTAYLAWSEDVRVTTVEGNADRVGVADRVWRSLGKTGQIAAHTGTFDDILPDLIVDRGKPWDLIFIDGHHHGPALMRYVDMLLPHLSPAGLLVCDDVHWSPDMEAAWAAIRRDERWTLTMDVFEMGVATQRPGLTRMDVNVVLRGHPRPVL